MKERRHVWNNAIFLNMPEKTYNVLVRINIILIRTTIFPNNKIFISKKGVTLLDPVQNKTNGKNLLANFQLKKDSIV